MRTSAFAARYAVFEPAPVAMSSRLWACGKDQVLNSPSQAIRRPKTPR